MSMQNQANTTPTRLPWNKGKLTGARDLAMFNLAIDSELRGCDVVAIRVEVVAASGYTADRATVRQKKTGRPVRFELSEQTRQAVDDYLKVANKRSGEFLFAGRRGAERSMTTRQYARLYPNRLASWTSADVFTPTITPPASVLCRISGETIFMTTGKAHVGRDL
jgi:integrase